MPIDPRHPSAPERLRVVSFLPRTPFRRANIVFDVITTSAHAAPHAHRRRSP
ncbi:MAG: hypothetical protein ACRC2B_04810 [Rubrivivax sp.]